MQNKYFDTEEDAKIHLEERRKEAYERIEKKGWKILDDKSFVYFDCLFSQKFKTFLAITTDEMIKDLMTMKPMDYEAELVEITKIKKNEQDSNS